MPHADPAPKRAHPAQRDDPWRVADDGARLVEGGCPDDVTLEQMIDAARRRERPDEA